MKGQINGQVDGWRASKDVDKKPKPKPKPKPKLFDRRVADGLIAGLQGDAAHALELMGGVKTDNIQDERPRSRARIT